MDTTASRGVGYDERKGLSLAPAPPPLSATIHRCRRRPPHYTPSRCRPCLAPRSTGIGRYSDLVGATFIGIGIAVLVALDKITDLIPAINTIPILVIVIGCIIFLIAFFGCCGAVRENGCLLIMYAVCMLIMAGANIWLAVAIFNNLNGLMNTIEEWVDTAFQQHGQTLNGMFRALEELLRCCGTTGKESYNDLLFIPSSCCPLENCDNADTYYDGCSAKFTEYLTNFGNIVGYIVIVVICIEVTAMIFALFLNSRISKAKRGY
ncbi:leukocyte surface antigen CD53-like [Hyposmocoma kahamanoa]|uniref:leukocyte surface antigen CD53-like n=1 Tax=Hyposmocoma kahamanoa TaxID=1477025 RepID=UPI000E6DA2EE|nr:leukocyte surface antigen CD53-like [Hyposmocoma kahamanoa]